MKREPEAKKSNTLKYALLVLFAVGLIATASVAFADTTSITDAQTSFSGNMSAKNVSLANASRVVFGNQGFIRAVETPLNYSYYFRSAGTDPDFKNGTTIGDLSLFTYLDNGGTQQRIKFYSGTNYSVTKFVSATGVSGVVDFSLQRLWNGYMYFNNTDHWDWIHTALGYSIDFQTANADGSMSPKFFINGENSPYGNGSVNVTTDFGVSGQLHMIGNLTIGNSLQVNTRTRRVTIGPKSQDVAYLYIYNDSFQGRYITLDRGGAFLDFILNASGHEIVGTSKDVYVGTSDTNELHFTTQGTKRTTLDSIGNFGIGTTDPNQPLDVNGSVNISGSGSTLTLTGMLGVNTAPTADIDVLKDTTPQIVLRDSSARITVLRGITTSQTAAVGTYSNHPFAVIVQNTTRATFDTNGRLGIGTTTPASTLHVVGELNVTGVGGDGVGSVLCIKANQAIGTCSDAINATGECTCA